MDMRTDLACERHRADLTLPGVDFHTTKEGRFRLEELRISSDEGAREVGRPPGRYVTVHFPPPWQWMAEEAEGLTALLVRVLLTFCPAPGNESREQLLVAGLGNAELTADAIGSKTVQQIHATHHLEKEDPELFRSLHCHSICTLCPGVLSQTGMEVGDVLQGAVQKVQPTLLLAVDALAARSCDRLVRTVQICNTGLVPGSGIGNARRAVNEQTMGVPVVAVGIPTVVDAATLVLDVLEKAGQKDISPSLEAVLAESNRFFVSPKECDLGVAAIARVLADAVNCAFGISLP